jgi:thiamine transport system permease protein
VDRRLDEGGAALSRRRASPALILLAPALAFLLLFLVYPLQGILRESFFGEAASGGLGPLVEDSYYLERAWFTFWQASLSAAITLVLALPCAWVLARFEFPGKRAVEALVTVPFVLPTIVVAVAFTALLGPNGLVNDALMRVFPLDHPPVRLLNTLWAILIAHVFYNVALAARIISTAWARLPEQMEDAAAVLGAGPWERFRRVTLPLLRTPILAAGSLVFLFCFMSFGVVLILGGPQYSTIETEVYRETVFLFRLPVAAALASLQLLFTFAAMWVYSSLQRTNQGSQGAERSRQRPHARGARLAAAGILAILLLATVLPLAALAERSVHGSSGFTLDFYRTLDDNARGQILFVTPLRAVRNSLAFAALTVALAVPLGTLAAYGILRARSSLLEALLLLPLGVSAVTLGLGFLVTFDSPPLELRNGWFLIVAAHTLAATPFVIRAVGSQARSIDPRLREAAAMLGANPVRAFLEVDLPLVWRAILVGAVFAFATSMGEFGATLLIARPEWPTIPVAVFRYLGQPGALNYGQALAMSTILMGVTAAGFVIIDRLRFRDVGTF